jgi:hypothetical protein
LNYLGCYCGFAAVLRGKTNQAGQGAEIDLPPGETCRCGRSRAWQAVAKREAVFLLAVLPWDRTSGQ